MPLVPPDDPSARARRAKARASWPGTVMRLGDLPEVEVIDAPPAELMGMVTELTRAAWALMGEPFPAYARSEAPGRIIRSSDDGG
jgi:hypothetical protein